MCAGTLCCLVWKPGRDNFPDCVAGVESLSPQSPDYTLGARKLAPSHTPTSTLSTGIYLSLCFPFVCFVVNHSQPSISSLVRRSSMVSTRASISPWMVSMRQPPREIRGSAMRVESAQAVSDSTIRGP